MKRMITVSYHNCLVGLAPMRCLIRSQARSLYASSPTDLPVCNFAFCGRVISFFAPFSNYSSPNRTMDTDEPRASKDTWTTVGKKPVVKKDKSSEGTGGGIVGSTRAAAMAKAQQNSTTAVKKPEAIRIREEQLKRLAKKTAPLPEIFTRRSESDSNSVDSDAEEQRSKRDFQFPTDKFVCVFVHHLCSGLSQRHLVL